jgi:hypothetical protein
MRWKDGRGCAVDGGRTACKSWIRYIPMVHQRTFEQRGLDAFWIYSLLSRGLGKPI